MRNSRISSRVSRVSELPSAGGKLVSTESQSPTKQIGVRSPRCLGPSSPFAYLKEPDFMNIAPLDARSGKLCTIPVKNSTYSKKRRNLDTTLQDIGKDLENITFLFQEITPQAPIKVDKTEKKLVPKETGLQILESVLEWLKAASFDLSWAKTAIEEKDLDNSNDAVQSLLYDSMRSLEKLRNIHNKLMVTFNDYFRYTRSRNRAAELAAEQKVLADVEQKADSLPPAKSNSGINFSALSNDVVDLLQRERTKTAETYESRLKSLNATLLGQAGLIKKLTENLKGKGLYEVPRDSKPEPEIEIQVSKKTLKHKKKVRDGASDDEGAGKQTSEDSAKESQNKELLSLQKTLHTCQLDSSRLLQQNRALIETRKELTTSNQHKDKVIGELKAKLLHSELADKPKLDKLVVAAPKQTRETPAKSERPVSPRSRIIYVDSGERSGSPGPPPPEPPARPMVELLAQKKGAFKLYTDDDDDKQESGEGRAAVRGKRSGDVSDSGEFEKDEKEKKRVPGDLERVWSDDKEEFGDVGRTRDADKTEKYTGTRDLEKTTSDRSVVTGAGGRVVSGPDGAGGRVVSGLDGAGGRVVSGPDGAGERVVSGPDGAEGRVVSGPDGAGGRVVSGPDGAGGRVVSGPNGQGTKEGKGRDRRGKDAMASEAASAGGADAAAAGREKVGGSGHEKELKGAEDRAAGKAREGSRGGGSFVTGQEAHEGSDSAVGQRSKRLLSAGGSGGGSGGGSDRGSAGGSGRGSGSGSGRGSGGGSGRGSGGGSAGGSAGGRKSSDGSLPAVGQLNDQSRDRMIKLDRDGQRSDRVGGKTSLTDASSHGRFSGGMVGQDPGDMMMIGGIRGRPTAGDEKESDRQLKGYALGGEIRPGGIVGVGRQVWERDGGGKGGLSDFAFGVSKYSQDRTQARERDQHAQVRYGTPDRDFGRGLDGFEGRSLAFGAVGGKGMQDMGADVGYLPTGRPGSAGQQTSGFKYNLSAFMPQHMGQQVGWLAGEKEGVVPFTEYPLRGLRVIGTTALQCERPDTEKGLTGAFPVIQPLKDSAGIARVLRSYDVNLNDPNTFEQQLEFIKHSGTMDGLREAMKLLAPHLKLLGENEQGENVLMDVMRALQKRHVELITEEFQPATGLGTTETKQRKRLTFVTDRRQDICSARARQRSLLTQSQARGLVHLRPLLGHETNALSPCPPYLPAGYMEALPQKMMRDTFPHTLPHKAQRQQRVTKLRQGSQYLINRMTIDNLLKTIDKLAKVVTS